MVVCATLYLTIFKSRSGSVALASRICQNQNYPRTKVEKWPEAVFPVNRTLFLHKTAQCSVWVIEKLNRLLPSFEACSLDFSEDSTATNVDTKDWVSPEEGMRNLSSAAVAVWYTAKSALINYLLKWSLLDVLRRKENELHDISERKDSKGCPGEGF